MGSTGLPTKTIAGVKVIDTEIVKAATAYARAELDDMSYNHVMRSWLFSVLASQKLQSKGALPEIDVEAQAISTILHDLGWSENEELISDDKRFEVDGAIAARNWLNKQKLSSDWNEHRVQLIWDAIALHSTPSIAAYKEPVVGLCTMGIAADFQGPNSDPSGTLSWDEFNAIIKEYPRLDLAGGVRKIVCGFCRKKPATTFDTWMEKYGEKYVDGYDAKGKSAFDLIENSVA